MLNKRYDIGNIGLNYVSIIQGIISLRNQKSVLIVDNDNYSFSNHWLKNIGEIDKRLIEDLGRQYNINCLQNISKYLTKQNTLLALNDILIELTDSPYTNIKELARKLPECFRSLYLDKIQGLDPIEFDQNLLNNLDSFSLANLKNLKGRQIDELFKLDNPYVNELFDSFLNYLDKDSEVAKQLHYILQVMFQTVFSSSKENLESKFLILSLISPRYEVNKEALEEDLIGEYKNLGGHLKYTSVQDWGIQNSELKYILLSSIDGVTQIRNCHYFGQVAHQHYFTNKNKLDQFLSIEIECIIDHEFSELYNGKRIVFSNKDRMGSDFPYWEVTIKNNGTLHAVYSYADNLGTKASFYYHHALEDIYQSLVKIFPGLPREDWIARSKLKQGYDLWVKYPPGKKDKLHPNNDYLLDKLYTQDNPKPVKTLDYCGPDRGKSLGFYSYLLDIFAP